MTIGKSDLVDKTKQEFFHVSTNVRLHQLDFNEALVEKSQMELHKDVACCLEAAPYKIPVVRSFTSNYTKHANNTC